MSIPAFVRTNPARVKRLKLAVDCRCELCGCMAAQEGLVIHSLHAAHDAERMEQLTERSILVLCDRCHRELHDHGISMNEQSALVSTRSNAAADRLRAIMAGCHIRYSPPEANIEELYREALTSNHHRIAC